MMTIKIRYKQPESDISKLLVYPVINNDEAWEQSSDNFRFSSAVAEFGLMLRSSAYKQSSSYQQLIKMAEGVKSDDINGYRSAFVQLAEKAAALSTSLNNVQEDKANGTK